MNFFWIIKILSYIYIFPEANNLENLQLVVFALHIAYTLLNLASFLLDMSCTLQDPAFGAYILYVAQTNKLQNKRRFLCHHAILLLLLD